MNELFPLHNLLVLTPLNVVRRITPKVLNEVLMKTKSKNLIVLKVTQLTFSAQSQHVKRYKKCENMLKVNNKNTRTTPLTPLSKCAISAQ